MGVDLFGDRSEFRLTAEADGWRPGFDAGAAPVRSEQADGNAALLLEFATEVITDRAKIVHALRATRLPSRMVFQFWLGDWGDVVTRHIENADLRVIRLGDFMLRIG